MNRCPTCKQPAPPARRRTCFDCGQPMGLHDKWTWAERNGVQTSVHRHCSNPTSYTAVAA